jgi:hypothetical protein
MTGPGGQQRPWFGRDPALVAQLIVGVLSFVVSLGAFAWLNDTVVGAVQAVLVAAAGAWTALHVRPIQPTLFASLIAALGVLAVTLGFDVRQEVLGGAGMLIAAAIALLTRPQQNPVTIDGEVITASVSETV